METQVSVDAAELSTCSNADATAATDKFLGDSSEWEPSLIAYRLKASFQADWKAEVGRWLLAAEALGFIDQLLSKIERARKDLANPDRISGANDSSHLILNHELAGAMAVYYFTRTGWTFVAWEPKLPDGAKGDIDIRLECPFGVRTDIQIKAPDQPGEREDGHVLDGEYDERILVKLDKGMKQLGMAPGPQRLVVVSPQRLWADAEHAIASHLIGSTVNRAGVVTLSARDRGTFATVHGRAVGAAAHLHLLRGAEQVLYRCTVFLNPWAQPSAIPERAAFRRARTCQIVGDIFQWEPEMSNHGHALPSGTRYIP